MHLVATHSHNSNVQGGHGYWIKNEQDRMAPALVRRAMSEWVGALHKLDPAAQRTTALSVSIICIIQQSRYSWFLACFGTRQKKTASARAGLRRRAGCKTEGGAICRRHPHWPPPSPQPPSALPAPQPLAAADGATLSLAPRPPPPNPILRLPGRCDGCAWRAALAGLARPRPSGCGAAPGGTAWSPSQPYPTAARLAACAAAGDIRRRAGRQSPLLARSLSPKPILRPPAGLQRAGSKRVGRQ